MPHRFPRVSVIIPTYNAGQTICQAIDSVLRQTYTDYEIVVVDDGSTDDTKARLERYGNAIRYIYQENKERSAARNNGIRHARGEYIAFLDADDFWTPEKLAKQVTFLNQHQELGVVFSWARAVGPSGNTLRTMGTQFPLEGAEGMDMFPYLVMGTSPPALTVIARRACIEEAGMFDEQVSQIEDWDLWLRIALRWHFGFVSEVLAYYRLSAEFKPAKLAAHKVQQTRPYIIHKVFQIARTIPDRKANLELEEKALSRAYWKLALIDYAVGYIDQAQANAAKTYELDPAFFTKELADLIYSIVDFSLNLRATWTSPAEAKAFLDDFFTNLPHTIPSLAHIERSVRRMVAGGHGFRAWQQGESSLARRMFVKGVLKYPELSFNFGIWSITLKSIKRDLSRLFE